ncbi:MAG: hypothetical protein R3C14_04390 [Caldilineaceae bacterium]
MLTYRLTLILALSLLLAGCSSVITPQALPRTGSCTLGIDPTAPATTHIEAVLKAEGDFVVKQKIDDLMALWSEGAYVVNAKNTPNDPTDDQSWLDKDAIRHRYVRTVFPGAPSKADPADLQIVIEGDHATITATTQIGNEVSPAGDRWTLGLHNGCWEIESLTYNLEAR